MTVEEMLDIWQRGLAAYEAGDYDAWLDTVDPRITFITVADWPDGGAFEGPEATWRFLQEFREVFTAGRFELNEPVATGESTLVCDMRRLTSGGQSGATVEWEYAVLVAFREGRIIRNQYFHTRQEALGAAADG